MVTRVLEVGAEPFFGFGEAPAFAGGVVFELVAADFANVEVACAGVGQVEAADAGGWVHGEAFGEGAAGVFVGLEPVPEGGFFGVVGAAGVAGGGTDAFDGDGVGEVLFVDEPAVGVGVGKCGGVEGFVCGDAPLVAEVFVEHFGAGFGEAVGKGLDDDGGVVVAFGAVVGGVVFDFVAGGEGEAAEEAGGIGVFWGDEVGEGDVGAVVAVFAGLLAEKVEGECLGGAVVAGVDVDVVAFGIGAGHGGDGAWVGALVADDVAEETLGVGEEFAGLGAVFFGLEDGGVFAFEFPGPEEGGPVDVGGEFFEVDLIPDVKAEGGDGELGEGVPVGVFGAGAGLGEGEEVGVLFACGEVLAFFFLFGLELGECGGEGSTGFEAVAGADDE